MIQDRHTPPPTVEKFGKLIADRVRCDSPALRRAYVGLLVDKVVVTNDSITITGSKAALEAAITHGDRRGLPAVDRKSVV